jgi:intein/homing endonuclease
MESYNNILKYHIKQIEKHLANPKSNINDFKDSLEKLGIKLFDKKGNHKLMPDILKDLSDVYKVIK